MKQNKTKQDEGIVKFGYIVSNVIFIVTPLLWYYLEKGRFTNSFLSETFAVFLVAYPIAFVFWAFSLLKRLLTIFWILPIAILCATMTLLLVTSSEQCEHNELVKPLAYTETKLKRGWPFQESVCIPDKSKYLFGTIINTVYWTAIILSVNETVGKLRRKQPKLSAAAVPAPNWKNL